MIYPNFLRLAGVLALAFGLNGMALSATSAAPPTPPALATSTPTPAAQPPLATPSDMSGTVLLTMLSAEMMAAQGYALPASQLTLELAQREKRYPELYRRAMNLAVQARDLKQSQRVAQAWAQAFPASDEALDYSLALDALRQDRAAIASDLKRYLHHFSGAGLDAALQKLPKHLPWDEALNAQGRQGATGVLAQEVLGVLQPYTQDPAHGNAALSSAALVYLMQGEIAQALQTAEQVQQRDVGNENAAWVFLRFLRAQSLTQEAANAASGAASGAAATPSTASKAQAQSRAQAAQAVEQATAQVWTAARVQAAQGGVARFLSAPGVKPSVEFRMMYAAYLAMDLQQFQTALEQVQLGLKEKPESAQLYFLQGTFQAAQRQLTAALPSYKQALRLLQSGVQKSESEKTGGRVEKDRVLLELARTTLDLHQPAQAQTWLDQLEDADGFEAQSLHARVLAQQGQQPAALALLRGIRESAVVSAKMKLMAQLVLLNDAEQYQTAYETLQQWQAQNPKDHSLDYNFAMQAEKLKRYDEMEKRLRTLMAQQPNDAQAYNSLGYSLAERNLRLPEAKALLEKAQALAPGNPMITDSLGWAEYRLGDLKAARDHLAFAYAHLRDPEIGTHYGEVLWVSGDQEGARRVWRGVQADAGENAALQATLKRLRVQW